MPLLLLNWSNSTSFLNLTKNKLKFSLNLPITFQLNPLTVRVIGFCLLEMC
nr:MAG TPA: hypothetical protein [Caudoviricetes sp.]